MTFYYLLYSIEYKVPCLQLTTEILHESYIGIVIIFEALTSGKKLVANKIDSARLTLTHIQNPTIFIYIYLSINAVTALYVAQGIPAALTKILSNFDLYNRTLFAFLASHVVLFAVPFMF